VFVNQPRKTFVLVADGSRARLFSQTEGASKFVIVDVFEHPESRAKNLDLMSDKPGRTFASSPTNYGRSAKEPRTNPKRVEAEKFAREIGHRLATHLDAHAFDDLVIAAPPKFLGLLRRTFSTHDHLLNRVIAWHEKDFTMITNLSELAERLTQAAA
jgi:protein required for attachment to host cells